jgi:uncharacterized integral membrane protein
MHPPAQQVVQRARISARRVALALWAVVFLLLVFILETASVRTSATPCAHGHLPVGSRPCRRRTLGMLLALIAGFGRMAQRRTTAVNGKI